MSHAAECDLQTILPIAAYVSANGVSIGSGNGLLAIRRQAIIWSNIV